MGTNWKLVLAALAGVVVGAAGIETLSAQVTPTKAPPAYLIAEIEVTDPEGYKKYQDGVSSVLAASGGRFLVRGGKSIALDGAPPKRIALIAFDSMEKAQAWYNSPAYQKIAPVRQSVAKTNSFMVEGPTN